VVVPVVVPAVVVPPVVPLVVVPEVVVAMHGPLLRLNCPLHDESIVAVAPVTARSRCAVVV
jgi:hypothetical protein